MTAAETALNAARAGVRDGTRTRAELNAAEETLNLEQGLLLDVQHELAAARDAKAATDAATALQAAHGRAATLRDQLEGIVADWATRKAALETEVQAAGVWFAATRETAVAQHRNFRVALHDLVQLGGVLEGDWRGAPTQGIAPLADRLVPALYGDALRPNCADLSGAWRNPPRATLASFPWKQETTMNEDTSTNPSLEQTLAGIEQTRQAAIEKHLEAEGIDRASIAKMSGTEYAAAKPKIEAAMRKGWLK
ncbi:MAG: hypothetical protein HC933_17325 [Pleurocapsa sp. SU_196_0]|nr:hypothetical protein [Pleurocapsa sp. SU_196_0]